jgi:hypothetical protein
MIERCETCRFFALLTDECRRKAPAAFPVGAGAGKVQVLGVFPPTKAANWCGEFEARPESTAETAAATGN